MKLFLALASLVSAFQNPPAQEPKFDITEAEATEFARRIERDQAEGRESEFDALFDRDGLVEDSAADLNLTATEKADFLGGFKKSSLGKSIGASLGFTYQFLRVRTVGSRRVVTFRLLGEGLNYHDLELKKTPGGIRIRNLFAYMNGEWLSTTCRRLLMAVAASDPARREKLPDWATDWCKNFRSLQEYTQNAQAGEPGKALAIFARFPESMKKDRMIQTVRIMAAARAGDAELTKASDDYFRLFPGDAGRDIVCLDSLISRKEFAKCFESLDRIDKGLGGDPFLDVVRGRLNLMQEKYGAARELGLKAVKNCPSLQEPHLLLIEISLGERKFGETVERIDALEKTLNVTMQDVETNAAFAEFRKSPEYREWMKKRKAK